MDEEKDTAPAPPQGEGSQMFMLFMFMMTFFIILTPSLRFALGGAVGNVLDPAIGFEGQFPLITLLIAACMTGLINIVARHHFTDWIKMAKFQKINKKLGDEMKEARLSNDLPKIKMLQDARLELSREQMGSSMDQMKPMFYTMIVIIGIFTWLWLFIGNLPSPFFSVPWSAAVNFNEMGPVAHKAPLWLWCYILLSVPLGQVFQIIIKHNSFTKMLDEVQETEG